MTTAKHLPWSHPDSTPLADLLDFVEKVRATSEDPHVVTARPDAITNDSFSVVLTCRCGWTVTITPKPDKPSPEAYIIHAAANAHRQKAAKNEAQGTVHCGNCRHWRFRHDDQGPCNVKDCSCPRYLREEDVDFKAFDLFSNALRPAGIAPTTLKWDRLNKPMQEQWRAKAREALTQESTHPSHRPPATPTTTSNGGTLTPVEATDTPPAGPPEPPQTYQVTTPQDDVQRLRELLRAALSYVPRATDSKAVSADVDLRARIGRALRDTAPAPHPAWIRPPEDRNRG